MSKVSIIGVFERPAWTIVTGYLQFKGESDAGRLVLALLVAKTSIKKLSVKRSRAGGEEPRNGAIAIEPIE